jgi:hypothetical protein
LAPAVDRGGSSSGHDGEVASRGGGEGGESVERLSSGTPTALGSSLGIALVDRYLGPGRRPARARVWSERHREEQESYCRRFVTSVIGEVPVRSLTRAHMQAIVDRAGTKSVGEHLYRCVSAMVGCGLEGGLLLVPGRAALGALARPRRCRGRPG